MSGPARKDDIWWQFDDNVTILQAQTPCATAAPLRISMPTWSWISGPALMPTSRFFFLSWKLTRNIKKHWTEETPLSISHKSMPIFPFPIWFSQHSHWQAHKFATSLLVRSGGTNLIGKLAYQPRSQATDMSELLIKSSNSLSQLSVAFLESIVHRLFMLIISYWYLWYLLSTTISHVMLDFSSWHRATEHLTMNKYEEMSPRELAQLPAWDKRSPG